MLTPETLKAKSFQATGRGAYRADDVDSFFAEVTSSYEQMFKENGELIKKISLLANKVEQYKEEEDSLRKALISAQTLADKIVRDAKESVAGTLEQAQKDADQKRAEAEAQAHEIIANAKAEADAVVLQSKKDADEILGAVNRKVMKESLEFEMLQKKAGEFRANLLSLYKEHLNLINSIPEYVEQEMPAEDKPAPQAENAEAETASEPAAAEAENSAEASAAPEAADEPESVQESFEDISSGDADEEEPQEETAEAAAPAESEDAADTDDGFTLDFSAFADEEEDTESAGHTYATIEESADEAEADDKDDDSAVSFKSFFKKK